MEQHPRASAAEPAALGVVHLVQSARALTARLEGEADVVTEPVLRHVLAGAVNAAARPTAGAGLPLTLVLDLSALSFCDVSCLGVLTDTVVSGRSAGVAVTVTGASPTIERVWSVLGCEPPLASCQGSDLPSADPWQEPAVDPGGAGAPRPPVVSLVPGRTPGQPPG